MRSTPLSKISLWRNFPRSTASLFILTDFPHCRSNGVIVGCTCELTAGIGRIQVVCHCFEKLRHLQNGILRAVSAVYCRNLAFAVPEECAAGCHAHAVIEDSCKDGLFHFVQCCPGDLCTFQNAFDRAGSYRVTLILCLQQQTGVFHGVLHDVFGSVVHAFVDVITAFFGFIVECKEMQIAGLFTSPPSAVRSFLEEMEKSVFLKKCCAEIVGIEFCFVHCVCHLSVLYIS